jgi:DNA-binding CsgD family transcriptional regulator
MTKKKTIDPDNIIEKNILSLYEGILPLLYDKRIKDLPSAIQKKVANFFEFDFYFYCMQSQESDTPFDNLYTSFEKWSYSGHEKVFSDIGVKPLTNTNEDGAFNNVIADHYKSAIERQEAAFPNKPREYHYVDISSTDQPKITIGFFRYKSKEFDSHFTIEELRVLEKIKPHIILLYRAALNTMIQTQTFQNFVFYTDTCAKIAVEFELSATENKLLTEILFGYSNKDIAVRNFISSHTAKTHVHNIFKKTGVKNRVHFIAKFFTSPDRIELP